MMKTDDTVAPDDSVLADDTVAPDGRARTVPDLGLPDVVPGTVWLVGAGPGDPGLLTLLAVHALGQADVIVHDALVDTRILSLAPAAVERIDMGKRGGRPSSPKQEDINAVLIDRARAGRRVLRLKGGDPFVFGRGPEEVAALTAAGIACRVVPGITAGIAGPAYAGIPVTAREDAAVAFATGTGPDGGLAPLDWEALARAAPTLVLYMALRHLEPIVARLRAGGRAAEEPAAVICDATTDRQRVLATTLERLAADTAAAGLRPPGIVVIGSVAALRTPSKITETTPGGAAGSPGPPRF